MKPVFSKIFRVFTTKTAAPTTSGHDPSSGTHLASPSEPASGHHESAVHIGVRPEEFSCCCKNRREHESRH